MKSDSRTWRALANFLHLNAFEISKEKEEKDISLPDVSKIIHNEIRRRQNAEANENTRRGSRENEKEHDRAVCLSVCAGTLYRALRWKFCEYSRLVEEAERALDERSQRYFHLFNGLHLFPWRQTLLSLSIFRLSFAHSNLIRKNGQWDLECFPGIHAGQRDWSIFTANNILFGSTNSPLRTWYTKRFLHVEMHRRFTPT